MSAARLEQAMILAAGRGERLRPLTDERPKALVEVGGKPLIVHHLEHLAAAGIRRVVINLDWLGEQIIAALGDGGLWGLDIHYSQEPAGALETAGGILQALPRFGGADFLVISADIHTDLALDELPALPADRLAHLVLVDNPAHHPDGDFYLHQGQVIAAAGRRLTYSGIAVFSTRLFAGLAPGRRKLRPVLEAAIAQGRVSGQHHRGRWHDVGTPARLEAARRPAD